MPLLLAALASGANFLIGDSGISNPRTDISGILFSFFILNCKGTKKLRSKKQNVEKLKKVEYKEEFPDNIIFPVLLFFLSTFCYLCTLKRKQVKRRDRK